MNEITAIFILIVVFILVSSLASRIVTWCCGNKKQRTKFNRRFFLEEMGLKEMKDKKGEEGERKRVVSRHKSSEKGDGFILGPGEVPSWMTFEKYHAMCLRIQELKAGHITEQTGIAFNDEEKKFDEEALKAHFQSFEKAASHTFYYQKLILPMVFFSTLLAIFLNIDLIQISEYLFLKNPNKELVEYPQQLTEAQLKAIDPMNNFSSTAAAVVSADDENQKNLGQFIQSATHLSEMSAIGLPILWFSRKEVKPETLVLKFKPHFRIKSSSSIPRLDLPGYNEYKIPAHTLGKDKKLLLEEKLHERVAKYQKGEAGKPAAWYVDADSAYHVLMRVEDIRSPKEESLELKYQIDHSKDTFLHKRLGETNFDAPSQERMKLYWGKESLPKLIYEDGEYELTLPKAYLEEKKKLYDFDKVKYTVNIPEDQSSVRVFTLVLQAKKKSFTEIIKDNISPKGVGWSFFGWVLTGLLSALGAPYWYDVLKRLKGKG